MAVINGSADEQKIFTIGQTPDRRLDIELPPNLLVVYAEGPTGADSTEATKFLHEKVMSAPPKTMDVIILVGPQLFKHFGQLLSIALQKDRAPQNVQTKEIMDRCRSYYIISAGSDFALIAMFFTKAIRYIFGDRNNPTGQDIGTIFKNIEDFNKNNHCHIELKVIKPSEETPASEA